MVEPVKFSSLGIVPDVIIGDKIPINDILNKHILVYKTKIDKSKFDNRNKSGLRMQMQIKVEGDDCYRSCFTGSDTLIGMMNEAMQKDEFKYPLETTIIKNGKMLVFT